MSAIATMLVLLGFAVLGYGVGRWHERIIGDWRERMFGSRTRGPDAVDGPDPILLASRKSMKETLRYLNRDRRPTGPTCEHYWIESGVVDPYMPPGYRAPCLWCDELKPLEKEATS